MKRNFSVFKRIIPAVLLMFVVLTTSAGGLLTNTNQSAQFVRMLSRNASTQIDAVYYNPAGLIKLNNGWHFALSNQSIFQEKTVNSGYPLLNNGEYIGKVKAPVFPTAFGVYKTDNFAFSLGFGPNGGGGSADFDRGLATFEIPLSRLVPELKGLSALGYNVTGYNADITFSGSSIFWGIQAGATVKVNNMFSVYGGVRILPSTNTYEGSIKNIQVLISNTPQLASAFLTTVGNGLKTTAASLSGAATSVQPLITLGAGTYTLAQVQGAGYISSATRAQLEGGLAQLGLTSAQIAAMNITQIQATYNGGAANLNTQSAGLIKTGGDLKDKEVSTKQTGLGFTPIIGINFSPTENLNIALKYEHMTKLTLTNDTKADSLHIFPDKGKSSSDIPGIIAVGIGYKPVKWLETQLSFNYYLDKGVNWGNNIRESGAHERTTLREIDKNYYELALGLQFNLTDKFAVSIGGMTSQPGVADSYQSDFSYTNPSSTLAGGFQWKISERMTFDAGFMNTFYKDVTISYADSKLKDYNVKYPSVYNTQPYVQGKYSDTLGKTTMGFAFGLSYSIF
jgi:long-chain fatty acid transport protein